MRARAEPGGQPPITPKGQVGGQNCRSLAGPRPPSRDNPTVSTVAHGMVDNFLRPLLVGKETRLPDYLVLISTLGGIAIFGLNGLVLGPVIAALFIASWDIFSTLRTEAQFSRSGD